MAVRTRVAVMVGLAILVGIAAFHYGAAGHAAAPSIEITCVGGRHENPARLRGRPVLVTFWATDCPACVREMPSLTQLYKDYADRGLEIIGVATAWSRPDQVYSIARAERLPYRIGLDLDGSAAAAFGDIEWTPTSFLIDPDGRIRYRKVGKLDIGKVRRLVASMLARTAVVPQTARTQDDQNALD